MSQGHVAQLGTGRPFPLRNICLDLARIQGIGLLSGATLGEKAARAPSQSFGIGSPMRCTWTIEKRESKTIRMRTT